MARAATAERANPNLVFMFLSLLCRRQRSPRSLFYPPPGFRDGGNDPETGRFPMSPPHAAEPHLKMGLSPARMRPNLDVAFWPHSGFAASGAFAAPGKDDADMIAIVEHVGFPRLDGGGRDALQRQ